jgi:hypothetical protein
VPYFIAGDNIKKTKLQATGFSPWYQAMEISVPQMKLLEAASFYGTQSKHLFNEKVKGDLPGFFCPSYSFRKDCRSTSTNMSSS